MCSASLTSNCWTLTARRTLLTETLQCSEASDKPKAHDWDHHLNPESHSRSPSRLKTASSAINKRGLLSLGTGRPLPESFPWQSLTINAASPAAYPGKRLQNSSCTSSKQGVKRPALNLSQALSYGDAAGARSLLDFITEHVEAIHRPQYADWKCCLTAGTTSAIDMFLRMFCERDDSILTGEYTYPGTLEAVLPLAITPVGVVMDAQGLIPGRLDKILSSWETTHASKPKPRLLYTIPTGQNPTGCTQPLVRRQAIYAIAEKHDLLIIEDDPYYFLRFQTSNPNGHIHEYLHSLPTSYISLDTSGRVLRLDSTSKILAPGLRCGWLTGSKQLVQRFLALTEVSTVSVSGVSQLFLSDLMCEKLGQAGFLRWLEHLSSEYMVRRDVMIGALARFLPTEVCSWNVPDAGMFVWVVVRLCGDFPSGTEELADELYAATTARGVAYSKGTWFRAPPPRCSYSLVAETAPGCVRLRLTYVATKVEDIEAAVAIIGDVIRETVPVDRLQF